MSPDPFFYSELEGQKELNSCPRMYTEGFCVSRIHADCLSVDQTGAMRVSLSVSPQAWFEAATEFGETLSLARNSTAVLGQLGTAPKLVDWRNEILPKDQSGHFAPNLAEYAKLWAVRENSPAGPIFALEASDVAGSSFHRVVLTNCAIRDRFEEFVTAYQAPAGQANPWFPPNHSFSAHRGRGILNRVGWLYFKWAAGSGDVWKASAESITRTLNQIISVRFSVKSTLYCRGMINAAVWTPAAHDPAGVEGLEFFHGEDVGLHVNLPTIASAWVWAGTCECCDEQRWSLEIGNARNEICLALMAGNDALESAWRDLLRECLL